MVLTETYSRLYVPSYRQRLRLPPSFRISMALGLYKASSMLMFQLILQCQEAGGKGVEDTSGRGPMGIPWEKVRMARGSHHLRHKSSLRSLSQRPGHHLYIDAKRFRQMEKPAQGHRSCEQQRQGGYSGLCDSPHHAPCHSPSHNTESFSE